MSRPGLVIALVLLPAVAATAASTSERLELLERRVGRITDLTLQLDQVRSENRQLRGEIEALGYQIEQLQRKQRDMYLDIDQRLGALPAAGAPGAAPPPGTDTSPVPRTAPPAAAPPAAVASGGNPKQIQAEYQAAYDLLSPQQKRYDDAAVAFAAFVQKYPNDALAPNAQYWLGEAHYVSQKNAKAQQAFEVVLSRYPGSNKAPAALFKIGRLQQAAGDTAAARRSYQQVLSDYPDSPAAGLARQRLDKLAR